MPANNNTANVARKQLYAFSVGGSTTLSKLVTMENFGLTTNPQYAKDEGSNGTLWSNDQDYQLSTVPASGPLDFVPRANDLRWLLPLIFGGAFSGNDLKPAPSSDFFRVGRFDRAINKVFTGIDCAVNSATLSSNDASNGLLRLNMQVEACQMSRGAAGTWPSGMSLSTQQPFVHHHSVLTLDGDVHRIKNVSVTCNNSLIVDEFYNSRFRGDFPSDGQVITLSHESPFDDANAEGWLDLVDSITASLVYTNGAMSLTFTFPALRALVGPPTVAGRGTRVRKQITWEAAVDSAGTPNDCPVLITLDDTP